MYQQLLEDICSMSSKKYLSTFEISQTHLKKANFISDTISALGTPTKLITDGKFLTALR